MKQARRKHSDLEALTALDGPELVFGLVGAVGTDLDMVAEAIAEQLSRVNYRARVIKVSSLLYQLDRYKPLKNRTYSSDFDRVHQHMGAGTELRRDSDRGDILALLSVSEIRNIREQGGPHYDPPFTPIRPLHRTAYILRSLKHPAEIRTLRDIYGRAFFVVSAYAPRAARVERLARRIADSCHESDLTKYRDQAERLARIDEQEESNLGQNVREAFPLADVFVDARSRISVGQSISRFIELLFGHLFHTPTRDEYAMFHAYAAALRSADMGRQVGAAIATSAGDIITVGCNEVPRVGGGMYWAEDAEDARDFRVGHDSRMQFRRDLLNQMLLRVRNQGWLTRKISREDPETLTASLLKNRSFKESLAANILEFGRSVHAEMAAITDAARRGVSVAGTTLYSTTFPCHLCARHIVSAGILRVVYVEPYPKSVAAQLYEDSIEVDPDAPREGRVAFQPFVGISPNIYSYIFRPEADRKTPTGKAVEWSPTRANPKLRRFVLSYVMIEEKVVGALLPALLERMGIKALNG